MKAELAEKVIKEVKKLMLGSKLNELIFNNDDILKEQIELSYRELILKLKGAGFKESKEDNEAFIFLLAKLTEVYIWKYNNEWDKYIELLGLFDDLLKGFLEGERREKLGSYKFISFSSSLPKKEC